MAIAFVTATGAEFTAATTYTVSGFTITGTNNYAVVSVGLRHATADITSVTFNGVAMTELGDVLRAASTLHVWTFGLANPTTGDVVITGDTSLAAEVTVSHYQGVAQTGSTGTVATADGTGTTPSVAVTSAVDEMVVDAVGWNAGGDGTAGASQTKRAEGVSGNGISMDMATSDEAGASSVTMSWTVTDGGGWVILGVPLKPVGGPAPSVNDAVTVTENVNIQVINNVVVNDSISVAESVGFDFIRDVVVFDSIAVAENVAMNVVNSINVNDAITVAEAVTVLIPLLVPSVSDSITVTENLAMGGEMYVSVNDSISVAESVTVLLPFLAISVNDTVTVSEAVDLFLQVLWTKRTAVSSSWTDRTAVSSSYTNRDSVTTVWEPREQQPGGGDP